MDSGLKDDDFLILRVLKRYGKRFDFARHLNIAAF